MSSTTGEAGKKDVKSEKVETAYQKQNYGDDESISSQEIEREKIDVDVEEYFKTHLLKEDDVDAEEAPKKRWVDRFKTRATGNLILVIFSRKLFFRHRSLITTFVEVFFSPLMILGIFAAFTHGISWDKAHQEKIMYEDKLRFPETETEQIKQDFRNKYCDSGGRIFLLFYPNTTLVRKILTEVLDEFDIEERNRFRNSREFNCNSDEYDCSEPTGLIACESPQDILEVALLHRKDRRKHMEPIGVVFDYDGEKTDTDEDPIIPKSLRYRIRLFSEELSQTSDYFPYVEPPRSKSIASPYVKLGFIGLQYAIDEAYLEIVDDMIRDQLLDVTDLSRQNLLGRDVKVGAEILNDPNFQFIGKYELQAWPLRIFKMFHYPNFMNRNLKELIVSVVSSTMLLSYSFFTFFIVKQIVTENDSEIKTLLKLHHLPLYMHWVVLFFHTLLLRFVTAALITWFLFMDFDNGAILTRSDRVVVFLFIYTHLISYTFFTFYLSSTFNGALMGGVSAVLIGYLTFVIPLILKVVELMTFVPNLVAAIFLPHWAFINGIRQIIISECEDKGLGFGNILLPPVAGTHLSFFQATVILVGSALFYFSLAVFRDITKQRALSHTHKWYQCGKAKREKMLQKQDHEEMMQDLKEDKVDEVFQKPDVYEEDQRTSIVHVRHLTTKGGKHKIVLDNINLNFYHGEITILLGHTGSGKSSLIHVMGGMLVPSHGYVTINGFDVNYDRRKAREFLGYCPQKVILFNLLSVMEHVVLCYRLRGVSNSEAKKHAFGLLTLMRLWDLRTKIPSELNDTNKRKLSISLALVNAPQVLLLDEPTHGLDSISRREVWGILVELRRHHTIIIGTNRMDEAEYLGDRIALLSHGRLICFGSPKYLKSHYDTGYFLKIFPSAEKPFNSEKTIQLIEKYMDEPAKQDESDEILETKKVVIFELRKTKMGRYPDFFDELDKEMESLGIDEYSVAQISLYDIFIKICEAVSLDDEAPDKSFRRGHTSTRRKAFDNMTVPSILEHEEYTPSKTNSASALVKKRLIVLRSKHNFFLWEYVIPLIIIGAVVYHANLVVNPIDDPTPLELSLQTFKNAEVFYRLGSTDVPISMNRSYKGTMAHTLKHNGLMLLKTEQVLTKFEESNSSKDGYAREMHFVGIEFRQLEKLVKHEAHTKKKKQKFVEFVGYYSSDALHAPPVVMNLISNVMLDTFFPKSTGVNRDLVVINDPFPGQIVSEVEAKCEVTCILFAVIVSFALSLFVAGLIVFPLIERTTGMKHIQLMTGLHPFVYWGTEFLCDFFITLIYSCLVVGIFMVAAATLIKPIEIQDILSITLIIVLYLCWSAIPFAYFLSCLCPNKMSGYGFYVVLHMLLGLVPGLVLNFGEEKKVRSTEVIFFRNFMNIFPMYTVTAALHRWFEVDALGSECHTVPKSVKEICGKISPYDDSESRQTLYDFIIDNDNDFAKCCDMVCNSKNRNKCFHPPPYFDWEKESIEEPLLIQFCIYFVLQGFLYWGLLILIDRGIIANILHNAVLKFIRAHSKNTVRSRPPDVQAEWDRCEEIIERKTFPEDVALVCQDLTKSYATVMVVNDVSIAIKKGECIGILGGGGSGKSTLIKLLCGETLATTGEVFIGDSSIHHHRVEFLSKIGYCPQNFCLFERFTATQMLELMGRLRGIPKSQLKSHVDQWLNLFGLYEARNDKCKHLTYGMRRCVCAAMCLIGGSEVILMDEPTSGIDPSCRQKFWMTMKLLTNNGRTVVFTSYNTDECSYLSTRMIVMCEGNVQCLGHPQELIMRFSRGFTILIRLRHDVLSPMEIMSTTMGRVVALKKSMKKTFKHLTLRDEQDNLLLYFLRDLGFTWGELFRRMRAIMDENYEVIEKYYISESTLDEIFILLTNKYREMDAPRKMEPKSAGSITQKQAEKKALKAVNKSQKSHDSS